MRAAAAAVFMKVVLPGLAAQVVVATVGLT
jgi:hypothetical protein